MADIRPAAPAELPRVLAFYHAIIEDMAEDPYFPCWERDVHPTDRALAEAVRRGELFLLFTGGEIAGAMVLDQDQGEMARACPPDFAPSGIAVVHLLCVHPRFSRRGYARALVAHAIFRARSEGRKAVRLDVLEGNLPAERLYLSAGFRRVGAYTASFGMCFNVYEYAL